jgi:hypothetical protein
MIMLLRAASKRDVQLHLLWALVIDELFSDLEQQGLEIICFVEDLTLDHNNREVRVGFKICLSKHQP